MTKQKKHNTFLKEFRSRLMLSFLLTVALPAVVSAQDMGAYSPYGAPGAMPAPVPAPVLYAPGQLDQLLAPIALYPDPLITQMLTAATYPLEVVEADHWRAQPVNSALTGDALVAAIGQEPWNPSVKSLVPFPQVLQTMDSNLQWTEQLGNALLAVQPAVMDSVQRLRQQALSAGTLQSTPQQTVTVVEGHIIIEPANPQLLYIPYYNPTQVYGAWPYPDYPPVYFPPYPGFANYNAVFGFGPAFTIIEPFWGWEYWDWHHHRIDVDDNHFHHSHPSVVITTPGAVLPPAIALHPWVHDPAHRLGVPYRDAAVRAQYQPAQENVRQNYRGYEANVSATRPAVVSMTPQSQPQPAADRPRDSSPVLTVYSHDQPLTPPMHREMQQQNAPLPQQVQQRFVTAGIERPTPAMFESLPQQGNVVRAESERGSFSRTPRAASSAPHPAIPAGPTPAEHVNGNNNQHH